MNTGASLQALAILGFLAGIPILGLVMVFVYLDKDPRDRLRLPLQLLYYVAGLLPLLTFVLLGLLGVLHRVEYGLWPSEPFAGHYDVWAEVGAKYAFPFLWQLCFVVSAAALCSACIMFLVTQYVFTRHPGPFASATLWIYCFSYPGLWLVIGHSEAYIRWMMD